MMRIKVANWVAGVLRSVGPYRETDSMNTHTTLAGFIIAVDEVNGLHDRVDRGPRELVTEHVQANLLVRVVIGTNGLDDALDRAGIREGVPGAQPLNHRAALRGRVGNPLAAVVGEHVDAFIVHHLEPFHLRVQVQGFFDLLQHHRPDMIEHAARRIDDEDDVLAVVRRECGFLRMRRVGENSHPREEQERKQPRPTRRRVTREVHTSVHWPASST